LVNIVVSYLHGLPLMGYWLLIPVGYLHNGNMPMQGNHLSFVFTVFVPGFGSNYPSKTVSAHKPPKSFEMQVHKG
jgi:hypothetical protein